jgi:1,6-anhydro-N-acetylmuramate kinase
MSIVMAMLHFNVPLSQWESFQRERQQGVGFFSSKNTDKIAQAIFTQLSHEKAVQLVAREFEQFPADLRIRLRTLCNAGNGSGNVRKGVQRLDQLMGGKLLREEKHEERFQAKLRDGWVSKRVNPAVAGATRKYGIVKK